VFPRIVHIDNFNLYTYGVLVGMGVIAGILMSTHLCLRIGIDPKRTCRLGVLAVLSGIGGAKVLLVLMAWTFYTANPWKILSLVTIQAGGVFSGGLVAAVAVAGLYIWRHNLPLLQTSDGFAPGLALGHAIGRIGCFAAGCCYGKPTTHSWGMRFTNPLAQQLAGTPLGVRLEPTQLFESALELANFLILYRLSLKKRFDGQVIGTYLVSYGTGRYFLEFWRGDPGRGEFFAGLISGTQVIAIGFVLIGAALWLRGETFERETAKEVNLSVVARHEGRN
jgi:phosphatidylglycerol---prolipoprotein diacylglyceryl transferase